jgi:2,6-dihydroxypseudooxynicotine hydrolase
VLCPTLLVFGKLDRIIPFSEAERCAAIAGVELVTYETGNHGVTDQAFASRTMLADWMRWKLSDQSWAAAAPLRGRPAAERRHP